MCRVFSRSPEDGDVYILDLDCEYVEPNVVAVVSTSMASKRICTPLESETEEGGTKKHAMEGNFRQRNIKTVILKSKLQQMLDSCPKDIQNDR